MQSGYQIAADRYSYLACLGWSMLAGAGVAALGRAAALPAFLVIATLGGLTWTQAKIWHDNETVWRRAVDVDPRSGIARANLGAALSAHGRTEEAMAELREAIRLRPGYPDAHLSLGLMLAQGGDPAGAVPHFSEALRLWPRFAEAHNNLGAALAVQGRRDEALSHFREALRLNPDYAEARNNLGLALAQDGKLREAAEQFARAVELNPEWIDARRNLEQAQRLLGRYSSEGSSAPFRSLPPKQIAPAKPALEAEHSCSRGPGPLEGGRPRLEWRGGRGGRAIGGPRRESRFQAKRRRLDPAVGGRGHGKRDHPRRHDSRREVFEDT